MTKEVTSAAEGPGYASMPPGSAINWWKVIVAILLLDLLLGPLTDRITGWQTVYRKEADGSVVRSRICPADRPCINGPTAALTRSLAEDQANAGRQAKT